MFTTKTNYEQPIQQDTQPFPVVDYDKKTKNNYTLTEKQRDAIFKKFKMIDRPVLYKLWDEQISKEQFFGNYHYELVIMVDKEIFDMETKANKVITFKIKYHNDYGFGVMTKQALSAYLTAREYRIDTKLYSHTKDNKDTVIHTTLVYDNVINRKI